MTIPKQSEMFQVVLQLYDDYPDGLGNKDVEARIVAKLNLTEDELRYKTSSGQPVYASRVRWSMSHLRMAGCIVRTAEGFHHITELGKRVLGENLGTKELSSKLKTLSSERELTPSYEWTKVYATIANAILPYREKQSELVAILARSFDAQGLKKGLLEYSDGMQIDAIDPFSFFAAFNRGLTDIKRTAILSEIMAYFDIEMNVPTTFNGIPVKLNFNARFVDRALPHDDFVNATNELWDLFSAALADDVSPAMQEKFCIAYDKVLPRKYVSWGLTMALYWIRPMRFIGLDENNRAMLEHDYEISFDDVPSGKEYLALIARLQQLLDEKGFPEFSYDAWQMAKERDANSEETTPEQPNPTAFVEPAIGWFLGCFIDGVDLVDECIAHGEWRIGAGMNKYFDGINAIPVGAKIALKKSFTRKTGIPFPNDNQSVSTMKICAIGTVTENPQDGLTLKVDWDKAFEPKEWYLFNFQKTFWRVERTEDDWRRGALLDFAFNGQPQDLRAFLNHPYWAGRFETCSSQEKSQEVEPCESYTQEQFLNEVFIDEDQLATLCDLLNKKLNVILQGPPGTGKTFAAKRLAYVLMGSKDDSRIVFKQFHQGTTYEDMIVGFRPTEDGGFILEDGAFVAFCDKAVQSPDEKFFFIIDEINRADISRVFGELLMTMEKDHRNEEIDLRLANGRITFKVPDNVFIIAMMNTADRSIAMMDYALRRRFAFFEMRPAIDNTQFFDYLCQLISRDFANQMIEAVQTLNESIRSDLGKGYEIGHSYFMEGEKGMTEARAKQWFGAIIDYEIAPLLEEYWFDETDVAQTQIDALKAICE